MSAKFPRGGAGSFLAGSLIEMVTVDLKTDFAENELVKVAACYASPKTKWSEFKLFLEKNRHHYQTRPQSTTILCGDFNIDLLAKPNHPILGCTGLHQLIREATTDSNSLLDHMYVSNSHLKISTGVLESHFSDHKPIFAVLSV